MAVPLLCGLAAAQTRVSLQPFAQEVRQVETTLAYLGEPLAPKDENAINALIAKTDAAEAASGLEQILDQYTLAIVEINPESRVKVRPGPAKHEVAWEFYSPGGSYTGRLLIDGEIYTTSEATNKFLKD
jgi:hypothetical protein